MAPRVAGRGPLRRVVDVVAWVVACALALLVLATVVVPRMVGGSSYVVLTGSMRPHLPPGTVVVVRPVSAAQVRVGDVVTYQLRSGRPEVVTHRVVAQGLDRAGRPVLRTRGDANPSPDPAWVRPVQVRGRVWYAVPLVGRLTTRLGTATRERALDVVGVTLLGYAGWTLTAAWVGRRRPDRVVQPPRVVSDG